MNRRPRRQGQLQTMEPIIVMVFLALIIGVMLMFYFRISDTKGEETKQVQENVQDVAMLGRLSGLPEIACPGSESHMEYCIDWYKAKAFNQTMQSTKVRNSYYPLFGSSRINITIIDLGTSSAEQLTLYNSLGNASRIRTNIMYTTVYDPSENPAYGGQKFAVVTIERGSS